MRADRDSCMLWEEMLPEFIDACLRADVGFAGDTALCEHLRRCPRCAAQAMVAAAIIRWREAEDPFNTHVLPLPERPLQIYCTGGTHSARHPR